MEAVVLKGVSHTAVSVQYPISPSLYLGLTLYVCLWDCVSERWVSSCVRAMRPLCLTNLLKLSLHSEEEEMEEEEVWGGSAMFR